MKQTQSDTLQNKKPETGFNVPSGHFDLQRLPASRKGDLRAWDAADELILNEVFNKYADLLNQSILILNDSFGALTLGLHQSQTVSWGDSYVAHQATLINFKANRLDPTHCKLLPSTETPEGKYSLLLIKIPKTLSLLEEQLCQLKPLINGDTVIIAGGMSRHIHRSTLNLFEKIIGTTHTSRATKKARLIFSQATQEKKQQSPYPKTIYDEQFDLNLVNHANVFSKDQLDIGTRFMLQQLDKCPKANKIVDLGCGNGALGIIAQRLQPEAELFFIDESYMAVKSAEESYRLNFSDLSSDQSELPTSGKANFEASNILVSSHSEDHKADLILCNPPFHQAHTIGDHIAWQMFKQSYSALNNGGELWVIGNRHLAYHTKLKKLFANCTTIASNHKFVVLAAQKRTKSKL